MTDLASATPLLEIDQLSVDLALPGSTLHVLDRVDLRVQRGETLCLVGESGCGKTMTSLLVMGLAPRSARITGGRVLFNGTDLAGLDPSRRARLRGDEMAMVFQDPMTALNPVLRIGDQLTEGFLRHGKGDARAARARALHLLDRVGISSPATRLAQYPHELSGGMRQRVLIAIALMCEPQLLVADEPTTALDVTVQAQVLTLLKQIQREMQIGVLLITHDLSVVAHVADRVAVMYAGSVVETATAADLFAHPSHPYTRGLLSCIPAPGRGGQGAPLGTIPGMIPALTSADAGCRFRARCALAVPACSTAAGAQMRTVVSGHASRCVFADRLDDAAA